jgi:predicted Zn-ribbon and HTH transcriptional regulator
MNEKTKAHSTVNTAIKKGILKRPNTCSKCGYTVNDNYRLLKRAEN